MASENDDNDSIKEEKALQTILYGFAFLICGLFCRQFSTMTRLPISHHILLVCVGVVVGELSYLEKRLEDPMLINHMGQLRLLQLSLPMVFFESTFNLEVHYMKVIVFHLILVVIPTLVLASVVGIAFQTIFTLDMNIFESIIMMTLTIPCGPRLTRHFLTTISAEYDLRTPLEAESLFGNCVTYLFYTAVTSRMFRNSLFSAFPFLFDIFVGAIFGYIVGKLMIMWISKMFKDTVNQTTIVIAFIYSAYAICHLKNISGFLCVVVIGLVMADRRAVMSTQTTSVLNQFMELTMYMFSSVACVQVGIYLASRTAQTLTASTLAISFFTFVASSVIRAFVLLITYPISRLYMNSINVLYIVCSCHLRDSYSCILAFTLIDTRLHSQVNEQLFSILILHMVYSFIVNYGLAMKMVEIIQTRTMSNDKALMLERAGKMINDIQTSVRRSLKSTMLTTDADWLTVKEYTRLKTDFMKLYRNKACLVKKKDIINQFLDTQALRKQAVRQIVISERTSYARQFEEGVLSRQSVINLMIQVNEALKQKQLIDPYKIVQCTRQTTILSKLEKEVKSMLFNAEQPLLMRGLICTLVVADVTIVVYTLGVVHMQAKDINKQLVLHIVNLFVFLLYLVSEIYKMIATRRLSPEGPWDILNRIILFVSFLDVVVTCLPLLLLQGSEQKEEFYKVNHTLKLLMVTLTSSRLARAVMLVRISPYLQQRLMYFTEQIMEKKVFIACDMAAGFIQGTMETFRKANRIVDDPHVSQSIRYVCHLTRLLLGQHLGFCQVDYPLVMLALKTKTAIRLTLNAEEQRLTEIKEMGLLGERDLGIIQKILEKKMSDIRSFSTSLQPLGHRAVILHLPWVDGNERYAQFLEDNGQAILFNPNDIIATQGHLPGGIFVILHGVVRVESVIDQSEYVIEPQVEKIRTPYYAKESEAFKRSRELIELIEFISRGNVIGEMSLLTGRPGHKTYRCATYVEAFFISYARLTELMEGDPDNKRPMTDLEMRMWRTVGIRQAVRLILSEIYSGTLTRMLIYTKMSDAFIIDGNFNRVIDIHPDEVSAVFLVQGVVKNFYSEARFVGPCMIPFFIQRILCEPEKGTRVIFLCLKTSVTDEETLIENLEMEMGPSDEAMSELDDDQLTISSGSSDGRPYHRQKKSLAGIVDKSVVAMRLMQHGLGFEGTSGEQARRLSTHIG